MKSNKENLLNIMNTKANDNTVDILIKDSQISFNADTINIKEIAIKKISSFLVKYRFVTLITIFLERLI